MRKDRNIKHGKLKGLNKVPKFYTTWVRIRQSCYNPSYHAYSTYGGKGIRVSKNWKKYQNFHDDMHEDYKKHCEEHGKKNTMITRKDIKKGFNKDNCLWATRSECLRRSKRLPEVIINGEKITVRDLSEMVKRSYKVVYTRLRSGWTPEEVLKNKKAYKPSQRALSYREFVIENKDKFYMLDKRKISILCMYTGIGYKYHSLEQIGKKLKLSRERISQLVMKSLDILAYKY